MHKIYKNREFFELDTGEDFGIVIFGDMSDDEARELAFQFADKFWATADGYDWTQAEVWESWGRVDEGELVYESPEASNAKLFHVVSLGD